MELLADRVVAEAARVQPDLFSASWMTKERVSNDVSHAEGRDMVAQLCTECVGEGVAVLLKVTAMLNSRWALEEHVGDLLSPVQLVGGDGAAVRALYQLRAVISTRVIPKRSLRGVSLREGCFRWSQSWAARL
jgi:hypothetical protein